MSATADTDRSDQSERSPAVLVAEDEAILCVEIAEFLRDRGFQVIETGSADEAIQVLRTDELIDVVFTDVRMPGNLDGLALAQWVRRKRPGVKVIVTSGMARAAEAAGDLCDDGLFIAKPYDPPEVESRIRQVLAH